MNREGKVNHDLDRKILLGYLSVLIVVLLAAAAWATLGIARSNLVVASVVGLGGLVTGTFAGRTRSIWLRGVMVALILTGLVVLSSIATSGNSYQFAWLFPATSGLLVAKREWPWWSGSGRERK